MNYIMKKISYIIIVAVIVGVAVSSFWAYDRYFKEKDNGLLSFKVERGSIKEDVNVIGEAVSQKEFDLQFSRSGIIDRIFVSEGQLVVAGTALIRLETIDFVLEVNRLSATLAQAKANLEKLIAGATKEDISISKTEVDNKEIALLNARKSLINKLRDAYSKSDDAVRNKADRLFNSPRSSNPKISVIVSEDWLKSDVESRRIVLEKLLTSWELSLNTFSVNSDIPTIVNVTDKNLEEVRAFLEKMAFLVNGLTSNAVFSQATIDGYRSDIWVARSNINTAITNLITAGEKLTTAQSNLNLAEQELTLKITGTRAEDIEIARSKIKEIESSIAITKEKIRKSTLYSPGMVKIEKIWLEKGELFRPGNTAISLSTSGIKIQADVSELEIGNIRASNGNDVSIEFDAFPKKIFTGKVISIEPQKVVKDGDTYYRINVYLDTQDESIRAGMSANLAVKISSITDVLKIPEITVFQKGGKDFVTVLENGKQIKREVKVGISDGESVEILNGLSEGETVIINN